MPKDPLCSVSADKIRQKVDAYFDALTADPTKRGGPADLLVAIGITWDEAVAVCNTDIDYYKKHKRELVRAAGLIRAHLETAPAWANGSSSKAIFLSKQQLWDNRAYVDKQETKSSVSAEVRVVFGDGKGINGAFD